MSRAVNIAANTTDVQGYTGSGTLMGVAIKAGGANAIATLYDGTSSSGTPVIAVAGQATNGNSTYMDVPAVSFNTGIFVARGGINSQVILYLF